MIQRLAGVVDAILKERPGAQELRVVVDSAPDSQAVPSSETRTVLNIVALSGRMAVGDHVLLNTLAVEMGLGTGGLDYIITRLDSVHEGEAPPGHIIKLRYT